MSGITENRSDKRAIELFIEETLIKTWGIPRECIKVTKTPADITVTEKDGKITYYEIKSTTKDNKYFGAATITEWRAALEHPDNYYFVVIVEKEKNEDCRAAIYKPKDFIRFATIPPFKVNFNIDLSDATKVMKHKTAKECTFEKLEKMIEFYDKL